MLPFAATLSRALDMLKPSTKQARPGTSRLVHSTSRALQGAGQELRSAAREFVKAKGSFVLAAAGGLLALNAAWSAYADYYVRRQVGRRMMEGVPPPRRPDRGLVPRPALLEQLREVLAPQHQGRFYHIITGGPGAGKSTAVREACAAAGGGVAYHEVNPAFEVDFGRDLGSTLGFMLEQHLTLWNVLSTALLGSKVYDKAAEHPLSSLRRSAQALHDAAVEHKQRTGAPFVLVLDSVDRLRRDEGSRQALEALVSYAQDWAEEGVVTVAFVASEPATVRSLQGRDATRSRAGAPLPVAELSEEEALQLLDARGVRGPAAAWCLALVGPCFVLLERCAGLLRHRQSCHEIKEALLRLAEVCFLEAGLLDASPQQAAGLAVVDALLASTAGGKDAAGRPELGAAQWRGLVRDPAQQERLLASGVLSFDGDKVTFATKLAETYARERLKQQAAAERSAS